MYLDDEEADLLAAAVSRTGASRSALIRRAAVRRAHTRAAAGGAARLRGCLGCPCAIGQRLHRRTARATYRASGRELNHGHQRAPQNRDTETPRSRNLPRAATHRRWGAAACW
ncbi:ribbon-helix-helix protein, CopG family [Modestobacter sp. DSM 44400]|uniref:ribbon-helix-helix protein, CopG family n=1 Tax=Modestobacter sp. DSM 44400 TaxID=1550230 RepID=UPI000B851EA9